MLLLAVKHAELKPLIGKTIAEIAKARGVSAEDAIIDLVIEDDASAGAAYTIITEDNIPPQLALPWVSSGSDAESSATEGVFLLSSTHPRAYGNFARIFAKYVREEQVITLEDAVRKATSAVATRLSIQNRGLVKEGMKADILVFDPATISDKATFEKPHQLSVGIMNVFVNGVEVIHDGAHTGAKPGQVVRGPAWNGWTTP
jgi:N-acyl-D-amino-acid deacylase